MYNIPCLDYLDILSFVGMVLVASGFCDADVNTTSVSTSTKLVAGQRQGSVRVSCPPGTFPCESDGECVNKSLLCDGVPHCKDGTDEGSYCDKYLDDMWSHWYKKPHDTKKDDTTTNCTLLQVPDVCLCQEKTKLFCDNRTLNTVPGPLAPRVTSLVLSLNNITELNAAQFESLSELTTLIIDNTNLRSIPAGTFKGNNRLVTLHLRFNLFTRFSTDVFSASNVVEEINLMGNMLTELKEGDISNMTMLMALYLSENKIADIEEGAFQGVPKLEILDLRANSLTEIKEHYFSSLISLRILHLSNNQLSRIQPYSFIKIGHLQSLDLTKNVLRYMEKGVFDGLRNLTTLLLAGNDISRIDGKAFKDMNNVRSVDLRFNDLKTVVNGTFSYMPNLHYIYFDKFYLCLHVSQARQCEPQGDGISSKQNLLENIILRICVWIVALLACGGNLLVVLGRFLMREDNQIHSFFIKNLSLADLLMGLYLLIIASHDIKFRGNYIMYDVTWRNSWECKFSGVLSTLSTEMSVLTLSVITLDRYISIMYPLSFRKRGLKVAYCVMLFAWFICIILAALPVMGIEYFGDAFYSDNAVCVPLHLHDPKAKGWEYSSFLFLGINFGSFGFIAYAYVAMFYAIHMSALPLRTSRESKERSLVKRFFFIVITDFMCWIPIIIIKIMALGGVKISDDLYAWVIVFALPVNSALNPLLYTLTTNMFKKKLLSKFTVVFRTDKECDHYSSSSLKNNTSVPRHMRDYEMGLLKRYTPNRSTIKTYMSYQGNTDRRRDTNRPLVDDTKNGNLPVLANSSVTKDLMNDIDT